MKGQNLKSGLKWLIAYRSSNLRSCHFSSEAPEISYGLNSALAGRGVIVKEKVFRNLKPSELQQKGSTLVEPLSRLPLYVRGDVTGVSSDISKLHFNKLLQQVTTHISSISEIYVHDGALSSTPSCDAKVRLISDSPSAVLSLSSILWATPTRAISHDPCPLIIYIATSIRSSSWEAIGLGPQGPNNGFIVADMERSSLILCGKAFADTKGVKQSLFALAEPIIYSRGGLLLSAGLLTTGNSVILLFAPKGVIKSCSDLLVARDIGVVFSSDCASPFFACGKSRNLYLPKLPDASVIVTCDSYGTIPCISKLSSGQAAYHFLAGYQNGKFVPTYRKGPSAVDPLALAKAFLSKLNENQLPSFLINMSRGGKEISGNELIELLQSTLTDKVPPFQPNGKDLQEKYRRFLLSKYRELPLEFSF